MFVGYVVEDGIYPGTERTYRKAFTMKVKDLQEEHPLFPSYRCVAAPLVALGPAATRREVQAVAHWCAFLGEAPTHPDLLVTNAPWDAVEECSSVRTLQEVAAEAKARGFLQAHPEVDFSQPAEVATWYATTDPRLPAFYEEG